MEDSKIQWTDATFNPWRGCVKVSPGCAHCYAEGWAKRTGKVIWGKDAKREHAAEAYWKGPPKWNEAAAAIGKPFRVFCASLADVCEDRDDLLESRARLMRLIEATPALTWMLCTKRPENFLRFFGRRWGKKWPKNVWAMTTAENQEQADKRIPELLKVPTVVRGVSYEPALGLVDFQNIRLDNEGASLNALYGAVHGEGMNEPAMINKLDWVIVGGESGGGARLFDMDWARETRDSCKEARAAFFMKQLGANAWGTIDDETLARFKTCEPKGDDMGEWPVELQVQEYPRTATK